MIHLHKMTTLGVDIKAKIYFYFHYDLYNHMFNSAKEGLTHLKGDSTYHLYAAISLILMNQLEEGIQHLEIILSENDVKLAAMIALKYSKNIMKAGDRDLVLDLGDQIKDFHKFSDSLSFYYTAFTFMAFKQFKKALEFIDKALAIHNDNSDYYALKGWILMKHQNNQITHEDIQAVFQKSLQLNSKNFNSTIGLTEFNLKQNNFMEALNVINKAVVQYTSTDLPLIQKLKIQFAMLDWEQAIETINRIFTINSRSLYARKMFITILLSYSVNYDGALKELNSFKTILNKEESKNVTFILESSKLFSRVCNKNTNILVETSKMLESALQNNVEDVDVIVEMGNQCLMKNQNKDALRFFKNALKLDESSFHALYGLLLCELSENGTTPQLQLQYEDLLKLRNDDNFIYLDFLQVKINKQFSSALEVLLNICIFKLNQLKIHYFSESYLLILDPIFMVEVANEYISHLTSSKQGDHSSIHEILKLIVQCCPGLEEAAFLLAKIQFIQGDINNAFINLENLLQKTMNPCSEAYLLMAQIQIQNGFHERAAQNLEICVSQNFKIRENPTYHYILGVIEKNSKNYPDAINLFSSALNLIGMKSAEISLMEKSSIYVELIDTLNIVGQHEEAVKLLEDATNELKGTPVEARILLSSASQLLKRRNIQGAIDLLSNIKPSDSCYKEAKAMHADILLKHRKDKHAYIQCYKNLLDEMPGDESYILMGDAYMKILEPDYALECYENALKESPKNPLLIAKMGQALVDCHYFTRAIHYYKDAIKNPGDIKLKLKLAELYMNLKQYDKGELILLNELEEEKANNLEELTYMQTKTEMMMLLSDIRERSGNLHHALRTLKDALDNQNRVKKRIELEKSGTLDSEINILVKICLKLGHIATLLKNTEQAVNFYKEGLQTSPNNIELLVALANLYMQMSYLELCQQTCSTVLRIDPDNETASVMMADIAFRKIDFDMALFHFTQLVTKQPTNWEALIRLIEILYRTANLTDCPDYLKAAEEHSDDTKKETKLLYCIGLYQWYSGNLNSALRNFNLARQDSSLGRKALYNMIEICLNLDDELLADQVTELDDVDYKESRVMALKTAERLINELKKSEMSAEEIFHHRLLSNFHLLSTRLKSNIEIALENFIAIASEIEGKENIGVIYGIAVAYTLLKQGQRAKNQLKRVAKSSWTFEDAKYLERCWLLLVDYYVQSAKYEIATDLINKVIHHNKGYVKSYEYLGFILEKEQRYKEAVKNYEQAWNYGGKNHPSVGFKLAYCLMKIKKYPEAINKAHEVLKINPGHPRIKKDILDKCVNNLRI